MAAKININVCALTHKMVAFPLKNLAFAKRLVFFRKHFMFTRNTFASMCFIFAFTSKTFAFTHKAGEQLETKWKRMHSISGNAILFGNKKFSKKNTKFVIENAK